ncbi:M14 family zinc carboxypeptidase [Natronoglycomyces albus]|uniref:Peptidase M14 n=1 Tax=Natronoglycomyces albus TaxID=2811108 RepID=A0A895XME8_9ACTN|nr:M14 family zinc carboxypeptidase [Natronoglycomyces albus]QSB06841.1 peptidase M14 [Natronoglycomyces albus]
MRRSKKHLAVASAAALLIVVPAGVSANAWAQSNSNSEVASDGLALASGEPGMWVIDGISADQAQALLVDGVDVVDVDTDTAMIIADADEAEELRAEGWDIGFHDTVYKDVPPTAAQDQYYGGYRTAAAHEANLHNVANANPDLAQVFDIGDSWLKTQGQGGHDIWAICLTNIQPGDCERNPDSDKPRISIISQLHAREISTGEISWRFIDHLVAGYGSDPRVTDLLDSTEIWIVPIANPDGVDIVASGGNQPLLQRKNANTSYGNCTGTRIGVDLNRNHNFKWGGAGTNPCGETYQGPSAGSEPETQALESLFASIHPAQKGPGDNDPAPADARDVMISIHSFGEYIIHPWAWTTASAPNRTELRNLGLQMAQSNGYLVGTAAETVGYLAPGGTDDFAYGTLGVASYTFEVGPRWGQCGGFLPAYSCMDSQLWEPNRDALLTAAEAAAVPYQS